MIAAASAWANAPSSTRSTPWAPTPGRHRKSAKVLDAVEERIGLAPGYAYEVLLDLAQPWKMPLLLVDSQGNFGSRGNDPPAN